MCFFSIINSLSITTHYTDPIEQLAPHGDSPDDALLQLAAI